ncbi:MAG TPA: inositol-3-phosphate synthase [Candidatus Lokiarchaeia archaeon]|nr:inositol-3-phosphate synthase [Candidatus Lokiarchaeia archaeon]
MTKKISDEEVLRYLDNHTYEETMEYFDISRMTVARIKKRNIRKSDYMPDKIRLAIVGMGNAASALIQGIEYYKDLKSASGLLRPTLAGFHIGDIQLVAAFDIASAKVGKPAGEALAANEFPIMVDLLDYTMPVLMGPMLDGVIEETRDVINPSSEVPVDVETELRESDAEIVLCLLPSGANEAVEHYAEQALLAGCAFINATPTNIVNNKNFAKKYQEAGLPLIGDDLQDQCGATIVHKLILQQMLDRGVDIKESYALDVGGGSESLNTIFRSRDVKRAIKSMSVAEALHVDAPIIAGTSDYVEHLGNGRNSMLWIVGKGFLGSEIIMDVKIQTEDGPNGGSVLADVIRATKVALNQGASGPVDEISAYGFKHPPKSTKSPAEADRALANFILGLK